MRLVVSWCVLPREGEMKALRGLWKRRKTHRSLKAKGPINSFF